MFLHQLILKEYAQFSHPVKAPASQYLLGSSLLLFPFSHLLFPFSSNPPTCCFQVQSSLTSSPFFFFLRLSQTYVHGLRISLSIPKDCFSKKNAIVVKKIKILPGYNSDKSRKHIFSTYCDPGSKNSSFVLSHLISTTVQ